MCYKAISYKCNNFINREKTVECFTVFDIENNTRHLDGRHEVTDINTLIQLALNQEPWCRRAPTTIIVVIEPD